MNNNPNSPTRSTDYAHNGQPPADTNCILKSSKLPVCSYDRKQALAGGLQREVPKKYLEFLHEQWDMLLPTRVFLTKQLIEKYQIPSRPSPHNEKGRLWDILNMLEVAIGNSFENRIPFPVCFGIGKTTPLARLHAVWSTADLDDPTPSVTIMLPQEH